MRDTSLIKKVVLLHRFWKYVLRAGYQSSIDYADIKDAFSIVYSGSTDECPFRRICPELAPVFFRTFYVAKQAATLAARSNAISAYYAMEGPVDASWHQPMPKQYPMFHGVRFSALSLVSQIPVQDEQPIPTPVYLSAKLLDGPRTVSIRRNTPKSAYFTRLQAKLRQAGGSAKFLASQEWQ